MRGAFAAAWLTAVAMLLGARPVDEAESALVCPPSSTLVIEEAVLAELARTCPVDDGPSTAREIA